MRRTLTLVPMTLLLLAIAVPAFAETEEQFTGTFEGLAWALGAGVVLGAVYFFLLPDGEASEDHDEHH